MDRTGDVSSGFSTVPAALHGRVFLLAFHRRFDGYDPTLFGFALRTAMLTELHLRGYLVERGGRAVPGRAAGPDNSLLQAAFAQVGVHNRATWAQLVVGNAQEAISAVREQLVTEGWLRPRRRPGIAASADLEPYDQARVGALVDETTGALHAAIAGGSADPWSVAAGLLAALAQLPGAADVTVDRLRSLATGPLVPISGLIEAIGDRRTGIRP